MVADSVALAAVRTTVVLCIVEVEVEVEVVAVVSVLTDTVSRHMRTGAKLVRCHGLAPWSRSASRCSGVP